MTLIEGLGWVGVTLIFSAYFLNSHDLIERGRLYQLMNIVGSVLFGYDLYTRSSWSGVTLQVIWIIIALSALMRRAVSRSETGKQVDYSAAT